MFASELPTNIDWEQINQFLRTTGFYKKLLLDAWQESEALKSYPISDTSIACLACLHEDLLHCYKAPFAFDANGKEDRDEEYRLLRENLHLKYGEIDADILKGIYYSYLKEDR